MEHYETPVKRPRTTKASAANHLYYNGNANALFVDEQTAIHVQQILSSLQQAVSTKQRAHVLHQLLTFLRYEYSTRLFQSHASILHRFVEGNCIHWLSLQLGYALHRRSLAAEEHEVSTNDNPYNDEVHLIFVALDAFYRQCPQLLLTEDSIQRNGSQVLRLSREALVHDSMRQQQGISQPIVSIWHSFSACNLGTTLLLQNPETLRIVNTILSAMKRKFHHQNSTGVIETILECLGLLKNLSYYGEDHRHTIVNQTQLLSTLTSLSDVPNDKARERLSAVLRNLALSVEVRSLLTQRADVLGCLVRLFCACNRSKNTWRNIMSTITSLAIDTSLCHLIVFYGDGVLIEQLKNCVVHSQDSVARKRALKALKLLVKDPSSTLVLLQTNRFLEILSNLAITDTSEWEPNESIHQEATEAFCQCANKVHAPMAQHEYVLNVLTKMLTIPTTNLGTVARALQEQASHSVNRRAMSRNRNLLQALVAVVRSEETPLDAKESACAALVDLSEDTMEIALPVLLDALVQSLKSPAARTNIESIVTNRIHEYSVQTILNLAKQQPNLNQMACHKALIQSLLRFAAATTTAEDVKKRTKAVILKLAAEL